MSRPADLPGDVRHPSTPRPIAWADGRVLPAADATVPLTDDGFLRGDAVFESILVRRGRTHALEAHLARLRRSAAALDLRVPVLRQPVTDLLAAWGERDGVLRLIVTRGGTIRGLLSTLTWPAAISLAVIEAPWRTPISGSKTLSYAANQWAIRQARSRDADDALIVDDGVVHELPTGTICLVTDGRVWTPDATRLPILDSVTVRALSEVVEVERGMPAVADLRQADELFVVSASRPVLPVDAVVLGPDDQLEFAAPGQVTDRLAKDLDAHIEATLDPMG